MRHMYTSKRNVRVIGMSLLLFLICSLHGWAQEGGLTITATDPKQPIEKGTDYSYDAGVLTVKTDKPVTITSNGQKTSDRIVVPANNTATITLNNVNIESDYGGYGTPGGPLYMVDASVTLILKGTNVLTSTGGYTPAISCYRSSTPKSSSLTIQGTGSLEAIGDSDADGIGGYTFVGSRPPGEGDIKIENGTLIGNSDDNNRKIHGETIMVTGGIVACQLRGSTITVKNGEISKPIHGGKEVNIHGGKVTATISGSKINITGGLVNIVDDWTCISGTNIIISGGIVILDGGKVNPDMAKPIMGTLTTTNESSNPGNAFIIVKSSRKGTEISDKSKDNEWTGVIILGDEGKVYGKSITLPEGQMSIPSGATLTVESDQTLTISAKSTLLVEGAASTTRTATDPGKIVNKGTIKNAGTIGLQGTFTNNGTYTNNSGSVYGLGGSADGSNAVTTTEGVIITFNGNAGSESVYNLPSSQIITKSTGNPIKPTLTPTRIGYTFIGWSKGSTNVSSIIGDWSSITSETDLMIYALWKYNPVITITNTEVDYGSSTKPEVTVSGSSSPLTGATIEYYTDKKCTVKTNTSNSGASSEGGVPKNKGTYYIKVNYSGDNDNMNAESIIPYTIKAMELTVNTGTIKKVYDGNTTVDMSGFTLSGVASGDEQGVKLNTSGYTLEYSKKDVGTSISLKSDGSLSLSGDKASNYTLAQPTVSTGAITAKALTITPIADQTIYSDEHPAYTYSGQVGDEVPAFTGNLGVNQNNKVIVNNLTLANDGATGFKATNYTLKLSSENVTIKVESQKLEDAYTTEATKISSVVGTDWHKAAVTLTPSKGFKIKQVSSNLLKSSTDEWKDNLVVDGKDGTYEVTYQLKRSGRGTELDAQTAPSGNQTLTILLDKTVPDVAVATNKLTATVTLSDATSGLASCEYTWNKGGNVTESIVAGAKSHSITLTATAAGSYPLEIKVTDKAGNKTTYNKTIVLKEGTPPTPPTPPTPVYTYYDVTLPAVEGATTDPKAGTHKVMEGNRFIFSLTLDADYNESVPLVTIDGTVLTPRESDGKYVTDRVWSDQTIEISGIVKNTPTANEDMNASATHIYQTEGTLCIDIPQPLEGKIYSAAGTELRTLRLSAGSNRVYGLPQGVCFVCLSDGTTQKVIIATH